MKKNILFVYNMEPELVTNWKDGLWASLQLLERDFNIEYCNLFAGGQMPKERHDFYLAWGAFGSRAEFAVRDLPFPKGLCLAGYAVPPVGSILTYDVIFYENDWALDWLQSGATSLMKKDGYKLVHAFGVNTDIFKPDDAIRYGEYIPLFDYLSVGSFSAWKRHTKILEKSGNRMVVGQVQKNNLIESLGIAGDLMFNGVGVMDMVSPEKLQIMYNLSKIVYIPADVMGGGERAVLEARACGRKVEIEPDNDKLAELLKCPVWDHHYYAHQLGTTIDSVLNSKPVLGYYKVNKDKYK